MEKQKIFIVWVGGTPNYFNTLIEAQIEKLNWLYKGYDNIQIEITTKIK